MFLGLTNLGILMIGVQLLCNYIRISAEFLEWNIVSVML